MIDYDKLQAIYPELDVDSLKAGFELFEITTREAQIAFIAQCAHESGNFKRKIENLNYSAQGLANTWPSRFRKPDKTPNDKAISIARQPEKIANAVYCNRLGNGPEQSNDGWNYRGRGYIQCTGKSNYTRISKILFERGLIDEENQLVLTPELLSQKDFALYSALAFWHENKCNDLVFNFEKLTRKINGGLIGLIDRVKIRDMLTTQI